MSTLRIQKIEPQSGGVIQVGGRLQFLDPQPGIQIASVNDIGVPGAQGFGVGIAPNLPAGFTPLSGAFDPASGNYGNYIYTDGSVMVWIPAFFYKWGTGSNGLVVNGIDVKPFHHFASVAAAVSQGYTLHRAFYDGGMVKAGFFIDKFQCVNNGGVASSKKGFAPLSTSVSNNPISALNNTPTNNYGRTLDAVKTRGADFFGISRFMRAALAMLSHAHAKASSSPAFCAWYSPSANFPKGNNNGLALNDINDTLLTFTGSGFVSGSFAAALTGSGSVFAKTTHNGQDCGVADVNGNLWDVTVGLTYGTGAAGTGYYVLKTSVAMKSLSGGNTLSADAFGTEGINANYDFAGASFGYASESGGTRAHRFGNGANQVLSEATSGLNWQMAGLALPLATGASSAGTTEFGGDYIFDRGPSLSELCPISGGSASDGSFSGVWALNLTNVRSASSINVGPRAGLYM